MDASERDNRRIVVGVDGSSASKAALTWAVREAARTGALVEAVSAYYWYPMPIQDIDYKKLARDVLTEAIRDAVGDTGSVEVIPRVVEGNATRALLDAARSADLLVVGNHGCHGFTEALLGSVAQHCIHHATCPVVVVRESQVGRD